VSDELRVHCFGRFEVVRNGRPIQNWRRDKAKTLLKHLVAQRGSIQREVLLELLWPELEPDPALRNLRVTLHALRRAMEPANGAASRPYILTTGDAYVLDPDAPVWIDTRAFNMLYAGATGLWRSGRVAESLQAYEAAHELYRDDYLVDDLYEEWTFIPREQLKDQYLLVVTRLADASLVTGDYERCIEYCHKLLARDASREDAYQHLMRCHALMGRPGRAMRWYELCRETLQRELNVGPSDQTVQLARHVSEGSTAPLRENGAYLN
jgi:LuxR family transcriptional regulator, maltose regulon positive regulatory protein